MKVAILLIGNYRTWDKCKSSFIETFGHFNPDIYVYCSDKQYEYHPFIANQIGIDHDNTINIDMVKNGLTGLNVIKITITDSEKEDKFIRQQFLPKFANKGWDGVDIYRQYYKFDQCLKQLNQIYNYIIKTRFDIVYHTPIKLYPNKISTSGANMEINDVIFVGQSNLIEKIPQMIFDCFIDCPKTYNDSIHSMLKFSFIKNKIEYDKDLITSIIRYSK